MSENKISDNAEKIVKLVVSALADMHPDAQIAGVEITYVTVTHDGTEDHDNCKWIHRHIGGTAFPDRYLVQQLSEATAQASLHLRMKAATLAEKPEARHGD